MGRYWRTIAPPITRCATGRLERPIVGLAPVHSRMSEACVWAAAHLRALLDPLFTEKPPTGAAGIRSDVSGVRLSLHTALRSPLLPLQHGNTATPWSNYTIHNHQTLHTALFICQCWNQFTYFLRKFVNNFIYELS